ncbi:MAG: VWA domain-containing protein [Verrucomicrobiae bacterium]|nr:VWA domain-containing protein [Verrucomicrobiae bacterium]
MKLFRLLLIGFAGLFIFSVHAKETLEVKVNPDQEVLLVDDEKEVAIKIDLTASHIPHHHHRLPLNLAVVLDRSGSMEGAKLEQAKQAAIALVNQLSDEDIFSLVVYDNEVQILIPAQPVEDKDRLKSRISRIEAGGGTALYSGVEQGADQVQRYFSAKKINRVILLSDGLANIGPSSNSEISALGQRIAKDGIAVTTMGIGDDYNEDLMASLAEASDANYYYVKDVEDLPDIFSKELGELFSVVARNICLEITLPPGVEPIDLMGRDEQFKKGYAKINLNQLASGQNRYVFLRCRLPKGKPDQTLTVAKIKTSFSDETESGKMQTVEKTVQVQYTKDHKKAESSINQTVATERELMGNVTARNKAVEQADANDYRAASQTLNRQMEKLDAAYASAPVAMQPKIKKEQQALREQAEDMESGSMSKSQRKVLKSDVYKQKNAK